MLRLTRGISIDRFAFISAINTNIKSRWTFSGYIERNHQRHFTNQLEHDSVCVFQRVFSSRYGNHSHRERTSHRRSGIFARTFHDQRSTVGYVPGHHRLGQRSSFRQRSQPRQILASCWPANHPVRSSSLSPYGHE